MGEQHPDTTQYPGESTAKQLQALQRSWRPGSPSSPPQGDTLTLSIALHHPSTYLLLSTSILESAGVTCFIQVTGELAVDEAQLALLTSVAFTTSFIASNNFNFTPLQWRDMGSLPVMTGSKFSSSSLWNDSCDTVSLLTTTPINVFICLPTGGSQSTYWWLSVYLLVALSLPTGGSQQAYGGL